MGTKRGWASSGDERPGMRGPVRLATGGVEEKWPATGRSEAFNQQVTRHFAAVFQQVLKRTFAAFQLLQKLLRRQIVFLPLM